MDKYDVIKEILLKILGGVIYLLVVIIVPVSFIAQIVFIILKMLGVIDWTWSTVFIPVFVFTMTFFSFYVFNEITT